MRSMPGRPAARPVAPPVSDGPLSRREMEVAGLVADGATNAQVAARLFISERTVESHVASIFNKLGVDTRLQVARWFASTQDGRAAPDAGQNRCRRRCLPGWPAAPEPPRWRPDHKVPHRKELTCPQPSAPPVSPSTIAGVHALEGLTLDVPQGSIYGFLGANGAGKTTRP